MKVIKYITTLFDGLSLDKEVLIRKRFSKIRRNLSSFKLTYSPELNENLNSNDLSATTEKFLNFYTIYGIDQAITAYGIKKELHKKGITKLIYRLKKEDYTHTLSMYNEEVSVDHLVSQLILTLEKKVKLDELEFKAMTIEWLLLQDYRKEFKRKPLPGQRYPGIGLGFLMLELIIQMAKRLEIRYIVNAPLHLHNAIIYSKFFSFKDPKDKALIDKLSHEYRALSLASLSWLVENEAIIYQDSGEKLIWNPNLMIMPVYKCKKFSSFFLTKEYKKKYEEAFNSYSLKIDREKFDKESYKYPNVVIEEIEEFLL